MTCAACGFRSCFTHDVPWHSGLTCAEFDKILDTERNRATQAYLDRNTKRCPRCGTSIEKAGGWDHMTCERLGGCGYEFCWLCLADYQNILGRGNHVHRTTCQYFAGSSCQLGEDDDESDGEDRENDSANELEDDGEDDEHDGYEYQGNDFAYEFEDDDEDDEHDDGDEDQGNDFAYEFEDDGEDDEHDDDEDQGNDFAYEFENDDEDDKHDDGDEDQENDFAGEFEDDDEDDSDEDQVEGEEEHTLWSNEDADDQNAEEVADFWFQYGPSEEVLNFPFEIEDAVEEIGDSSSGSDDEDIDEWEKYMRLCDDWGEYEDRMRLCCNWRSRDLGYQDEDEIGPRRSCSKILK